MNEPGGLCPILEPMEQQSNTKVKAPRLSASMMAMPTTDPPIPMEEHLESMLTYRRRTRADKYCPATRAASRHRGRRSVKRRVRSQVAHVLPGGAF